MYPRVIWPPVVSIVVMMWLSGCGSSESETPSVQNDVPVETEASVPTLDPALEEKWAEHTQGLPFVVGYRRGVNLAEEQGKPVMLFVTTTWCGWCKKLSKESFNEQEIKELLKNFVCVIVDGDTEKSALTELGATEGYPHVIFVSQEGEKIGECLGYRPATEFKAIVEQALSAVSST